MRLFCTDASKGYSNCRRQGILCGVLALLLLAAMVRCANEEKIFLKAPGLRLKKDLSMVIPAADAYANRPPLLPRYRDPSGRPAAGWIRKYIPTRRFKSDQSAWIYYRSRDLRQTRRLVRGGDGGGMCIWPPGSLIVIESFQGSALPHPATRPVEIAVMSKAEQNESAHDKLFYTARWSFARFSPEGDLTMAGTEVRECHQCHTIAFQLTGDLVFTRFP